MRVMSAIRLVVAGAILFTTLLGIRALASHRTGAPQRGGGRGNPAAALYTDMCAGCHGVAVTAGPRALSLFDDTWVQSRDDASILTSIRDGRPAANMPPFKDSLTDQQIWQMVAYIRTQAASLKAKPQYIPDAAGEIVKSAKQTFRMEVIARDLE